LDRDKERARTIREYLNAFPDGAEIGRADLSLVERIAGLDIECARLDRKFAEHEPTEKEITTYRHLANQFLRLSRELDRRKIAVTKRMVRVENGEDEYDFDDD
jgi:hypothetical protein